jgi:hypothetical protein
MRTNNRTVNVDGEEGKEKSVLSAIQLFEFDWAAPW